MVLNIIPWKSGRAPSSLSLGEWPLWSLRREMERIFDNFSPEHLPSHMAEFMPVTDVRDSNGEITVTSELPGLNEKDIEVSVSDDTLTIRGEKKAEKEEKGEGRYWMERSYGAFYRNIPLPCPVDPNRVAAQLKNGVLEIHLPKKDEAKRHEKKIEIKPAH